MASEINREQRIEFLQLMASRFQNMFHSLQDELAQMLASHQHIDASHYARVMVAEAEYVPWKRATELAATSDLDLVDAALEVSEQLTRELLAGEQHWTCEIANGQQRHMRDGARGFIRTVTSLTLR